MTRGVEHCVFVGFNQPDSRVVQVRGDPLGARKDLRPGVSLVFNGGAHRFLRLKPSIMCPNDVSRTILTRMFSGLPPAARRPRMSLILAATMASAACPRSFALSRSHALQPVQTPEQLNG